MMPATRQLKQIRSVAQWLLLTQHLAQAIAVAVLVCLGGGVLDYALRLPGWLRLGMALLVAVIAGVWVLSGLLSVLRFRPSLSTLALRAERHDPKVSGILASCIELEATLSEQDNQSTTMARLAQLGMTEAKERIAGVSLLSLINLRTTCRAAFATAAIVLAFGVVVWSAPTASRLAAKRWLKPLGSVQWPNRTLVRSLMISRVWPTDKPLRLRARVDRGYYPQMRTWVVHRIRDADGQWSPWQSLLMSEQIQEGEGRGEENGAISSSESVGTNHGIFERLIDLTQHDRHGDPQKLPEVELYFRAGDDHTAPQKMSLVARPSVQTVTATIQPPPYALGLIDPLEKKMEGHSEMVSLIHAVVGSTVDLRITFNKPIQTPEAGWDSVLPGLVGKDDTEAESNQQSDETMTIQKSFVMDQTVETPIRVVDQYGLNNLSDRQYRFVAVADNPPVVSIIQPAIDNAVLPTAVVETDSIAQDDVGVSQLELMAEVTSDKVDVENTEETKLILAQEKGRQHRLSVQHALDLQPLNLKAGDEVLLTAVASDVFESDGRRREPVRSSPRRLQIIDAATLMGQVRTELAAIRQQAIRIEAQQRRLLEDPTDTDSSQQQQLSVFLEAQRAQIAGVKERIQRNGLTNEQAGQLHRLVDRALEISDQSQTASRLAHDQLEQIPIHSDQIQSSRQAARRQQEKVGEFERQLIDLLDQGRDALALHMHLRQLKALQESLEEETRRMMPVTLGWRLDQLSKQEKQKLAQITERQTGLSKLADTLLRRMQATSEALSRQGDRPDDQAAAQVLSEAASIARRQGLVSTLHRAADKTSQNRLSDAGDEQRTALDVVDKMLAQLTHVDERHQAILRRRLVQLAEAIRKLIKRQTAQLDRLDQVDEIVPLAEPQAALRRHTIVIVQRASTTPQTEQAGIHLDDATKEQEKAILAIRQSQLVPAQAGQDGAIQSMKQALESIQQLSRDAEAKRRAEQRQVLQKAYEKLAQQQQELEEETSRLIGEAPLSRRQRNASLNLGHREDDLRIAARQLLEKVQQTLVFNFLHDQIEQDSSIVVKQLRRAQPDQSVLARQKAITLMLRQMAQALAKEKDDQEFASHHGGGQGGGGGSKSGGVVPPLAELKLLRGVQKHVYDRTRQMEDLDDADDGQELEQLSGQQRQLAQLGQKLLAKLQQATQGSRPSPSQ